LLAELKSFLDAVRRRERLVVLLDEAAEPYLALDILKAIGEHSGRLEMRKLSTG
jgi:hypothetical protein